MTNRQADSRTTDAELPNCAVVYEALMDFADKMDAQPCLEDSWTVVRIVGEFSAGKSRFLRELLGETLPDALGPTSALGPETRLLLEVTYGEEPELSLVERPGDEDSATVIKKLTSFPSRDIIDRHGWEPGKHRLRLHVPEPRLILPQGDGTREDEAPVRYCLVDTPGWNSMEDQDDVVNEAACSSGYHLGIIFVTRASRVDGRIFETLLETLADESFVRDRAAVVVVVTECPASEAASLESRVRKRVAKAAEEVGGEFHPQVLTIDFEQTSPEELRIFREAVWTHLQPDNKPSGTWASSGSWEQRVDGWCGDMDLRPYLLAAMHRVLALRSVLEKARIEGEYIQHMNKYRLANLSQAEINAKLSESWLRQVQVRSFDSLLEMMISPLPVVDEHPVARWHTAWFVPKVEAVNVAFTDFAARLQKSLASIATADHFDNDLLRDQLDQSYNAATEIFHSSFTCLVEVAADLLERSLDNAIPQHQLYATLFKLSIIQARYEDYCLEYSGQ
jgi:hypothetical protein